MTTAWKRAIFWTLFTVSIGYSLVVYTAGTNYKDGAASMSAAARAGRMVFQQNNCMACHQIFGLGGYMGPDLTNVASRTGGLETARMFIESGTDKMPNFHLDETDVSALLTYLQYIDDNVTYPVKNFTTTWYGTVVPNASADE